jgi:hypothetical protein
MRDGVEAAGVEGVAASQPANRQPTSADHAVQTDRLLGVCAAAGRKPTPRSEKRADQTAVGLDEEQHDGANGIQRRAPSGTEPPSRTGRLDRREWPECAASPARRARDNTLSRSAASPALVATAAAG